MKRYYINPVGTGKTVGPLAEEEILNAIKDGTYEQDALVWCEGMAEWKPAKDVLPVACPPLPNQLRMATPMPPKPSSHMAGAIIALILSLPIDIFFPLPGVFAIIAMVNASRSNKLWVRRHQDKAARAANLAATFCNWSYIISGLCILFFILVVALH